MDEVAVYFFEIRDFDCYARLDSEVFLSGFSVVTKPLDNKLIINIGQVVSCSQIVEKVIQKRIRDVFAA